MHLFYSLIASGLLMLTEVPAEQPPPPVPYYALSYSVGYLTATPTDVSISATHHSASEVPIDPIAQYDAWYIASNHVDNSGLPAYPSSPQASQESNKDSLPPAIQNGQQQAGPEANPTALRSSPTTQAKTTNTQGAIATYREQSQLPITGYAMYYNPNVMQEVLTNRIAMGHISACIECVGNVALLRAGDLNRRVWIQWADGVVDGPYLVADVAASHHVAQLLARNWVVDVDNRTAVRRGMAGPVMVTVWGERPSTEQQGAPPFAPLYPATPIVAPVMASAPLALATPVPTMTPSPALTPVTKVPFGFPADTPIPTITPLPALSTSPSPTTLAPTATIAQSLPPTATPLPTNTPLPLATSVPSPESAPLTSRGFPTETAVPTITPLPALIAAPASTQLTQGEVATATAVPTATFAPSATPMPTATSVPTDTPQPTATPMPTATIVPTATPMPTDTPVPTATAMPTATPTAQPTATSTPTATFTLTPTALPTVPSGESPTATTVIPKGGFPPDTPVPTVTPLPLITPIDSPTPSAGTS